MEHEAMSELLGYLRVTDFKVGGADFVLVPDGMRAECISENKPVSSNPQARNQFDDCESFAQYVNRHRIEGTTLIGCIDTSIITAAIDYFLPENGGASKSHWAQWKLRKSEAFKAWEEFEGSLHSQSEFLQFLEENAETDIMSPAPAAMLDLVRDFQAVKNEDFKSSQRLDNGDRAFKFKSETNVVSAIEVPTEILLSIPIYEGESPVTITCKFRYRIDGGVLRMGFQFHRVREMLTRAFKQARDNASQAIGLPVMAGRFDNNSARF